MKFCYKCGTELADEAKYCPSCGKPVVKQISSASEKTSGKNGEWLEWLNKSKNNIVGNVILIDTNVYMDNPKILQHYTQDTIIVPTVIIGELDVHSKASGDKSANERAYKARTALKAIEKYKDESIGKIFYVPINKYKPYVDDILIDGAVILNQHVSTHLVTSDRVLQMKAEAQNVPVIKVQPVTSGMKLVKGFGKKSLTIIKYIFLAVFLAFWLFFAYSMYQKHQEFDKKHQQQQQRIENQTKKNQQEIEKRQQEMQQRRTEFDQKYQKISQENEKRRQQMEQNR